MRTAAGYKKSTFQQNKTGSNQFSRTSSRVSDVTLNRNNFNMTNVQDVDVYQTTSAKRNYVRAGSQMRHTRQSDLALNTSGQKGHDALRMFAQEQLTLLSEKQYNDEASMRNQLIMEQSNMTQTQQSMKNRRLMQDAYGNPDHMRTSKSNSKFIKNMELIRDAAASSKNAKSLLQRKYSQANIKGISSGMKIDDMNKVRLQQKDKQAYANQDQINRPYEKNVEKTLLCRNIRDRLRKEFWAMFRNAESAYAALDFTGLGYIPEQTFFDCIIIRERVPYSVPELRMYFKEYNLFNEKTQGLDFDNFKKNFFPHLYLVQDPEDDADDKDAQNNRNEIDHREEAQPKLIEERLMKLEFKLKMKFSNCYESVRKAFLALDTDYDGYITVEDILKYFGNETDLNYNELKKLMIDKDTQKRGKINYSDFSKWLGNAIHMSEGFYFRHDSKKNPQYEMNEEKNERNQKNADKYAAQKVLLTGDLERKIIEKIQFQWKTLRKAFMDLNIEKTGKISRKELKFYLEFWGMDITEQQFDKVFCKFDLDGDGKISYKDFQLSIGSEMFPMEGLYFRQDQPQECKINSCNHDECWQPTRNNQNFCEVHQKMHQDESIQLFSKVFRQIGKNWIFFIKELKSHAEPEDQSQIYYQDFVKVLDQFGARLTEQEKNSILQAYPGKQGGDRGDRINICRIYDQKYNITLQKMYQKVDVANNQGSDEPQDILGYLGKGEFYREKRRQIPITEEELIKCVHHDNKLKEIMFMIKEIDPDRNGYVTQTELDDIMKLKYAELEKRDLIPIISKYCSIQNKILIDYKKFKDFLVKGMEIMKAKESMIAASKQSSSLLKSRKHISEQMKSVTNLPSGARSQSMMSEQNENQQYFNKAKIMRLEKSIQDHKQNEQLLIESLGDQMNRMSMKSRDGDMNSVRSNNLLQRHKNNQILRAQSATGNGRRPITGLHRDITAQQDIREMVEKELNAGNLAVAQRIMENANQAANMDYVNVKDLIKRNNTHATNEYENDSINAGQTSYANQTFDIQNSALITRQTNPEDGGSEYGAQIRKTDNATMQKLINFSLDYDVDQNNANQNSAKEKGRANDYRKFMADRSTSARRTRTNDQNTFFSAMFHQNRQAGSSFRTPSQRQKTLKHFTTQQGGFEYESPFDRVQTPNRSLMRVQNDEQQINSKLAYEWKSIFRALIQASDSAQVVDIQTFDDTCKKYNVNLTREELKKVKKLFGDSNKDYDTSTLISINDQDMINYHAISHKLGMHKESFNHLSQSMNSHKAKSMFKLKQLYQSIEPVEEETIQQNEYDFDDLARQKNPLIRSQENLIKQNNNHRRSKSFIQNKETIERSASKDKQKTTYTSKNRMDDEEMVTYDAHVPNSGIKNKGDKFSQKGAIRAVSGFAYGQRNLRPSTGNKTHIRKSVFRKGSQTGMVKQSALNNENSYANIDYQTPEQQSILEQVQNINNRNRKSLLGTNTTVLSRREYENNLLKEPVKESLGAMSSALGLTRADSSQKQYVMNKGINQTQRPNSMMRPKTSSGGSQQRIRINVQDNSDVKFMRTVDEQISHAFRTKGNLQKFRDIININLKKRELQNQQIFESSTNMQTDRIIVPITSVKQALNVLGVKVHDSKLKQFEVKGEFQFGMKNNQGDAKSMIAGQRNGLFSETKSFKSGMSTGVKSVKAYGSKMGSNIQAMITQNGTKTLGIDVQEFINCYA